MPRGIPKGRIVSPGPSAPEDEPPRPMNVLVAFERTERLIATLDPASLETFINTKDVEQLLMHRRHLMHRTVSAWRAAEPPVVPQYVAGQVLGQRETVPVRRGRPPKNRKG